MQKCDLIASLADLSDDGDVKIEGTTTLMWDFRVTLFDADGPDEPRFACLTLICEGVDDDRIAIGIRP